MATLNPFRYRSYYFDTETSLYYLQTRYYDPETGRFISQDSVEYLAPETINGLNLYAYCGNNPVMRIDPNGTFWDFILDIFFLAWSIVDFVLNPTWANAGWILLDVIFMIIPFATGGSKAIKGITTGVNGVDNLLDASKISNKVIKNADEFMILGQNMERVDDAISKIGGGIRYSGLSNFDDLVKIGGKAYAESLGYVDNMKWIIKNAWKGKGVISIGYDANRVLDKVKYINSFKIVKGELFWYSVVMASKALLFWGYRCVRAIFK